jgi:hypothetical protein
MGDRQQRPFDQHRFGAPCGAAVQLQLRWSSGAPDLDVLPHDPEGVAGAEGLHRRLLRCEPACQARDGVTLPRTIGNLTVRVDAAQKAIAILLVDGGDAMQVGRVDPEPDDVHTCPPA